MELTNYEYLIEMSCLCMDTARFFSVDGQKSMSEFYECSSRGYLEQAKGLSMDKAVEPAEKWQCERHSSFFEWVKNLR